MRNSPGKRASCCGALQGVSPQQGSCKAKHGSWPGPEQAAVPAEETPARAKAKVTYFESAKVSDAFSKGGVLFDGNGGALNYKIHAGRRVAPGQAETHIKDTDIIYVLQGTATFVTGGTSLDAKSTAPDELLGSSIKGGDAWHLKKGDVIIVPKGVPHWFKEVQGTVLYLVVKVR